MTAARRAQLDQHDELGWLVDYCVERFADGERNGNPCPKAIRRAHEQLLQLRDSITTMCDEACGLQPVQSVDESLAMIERELFEQRMLREKYRQALERIARGDLECGHCTRGGPMPDDVARAALADSEGAK